MLVSSFNHAVKKMGISVLVGSCCLMAPGGVLVHSDCLQSAGLLVLFTTDNISMKDFLSYRSCCLC